MATITTLRPGLLVSLKTSITGNVFYNKQDIEDDHLEPDGTRKAKWETERTISNPAEYEAASKLRGKCRSLITGVCSRSTFGLLCPEDKAERLYAAVKEAQDAAALFNLDAEQTRISVYIIAGRVAQDDVSAMRAINSEVRDLLETMEDGLKRLDVSVVRDAASKAKELGAMLAPDAAARIQDAVAVARSAARRIVKAAEAGAAEIDQATLVQIRGARTAFLDLDEGTELVAPESVGRAIDLEPEAAPADDADNTEDAPALSDNPDEHSALCQCAACETLYGSVVEAINQPSLAARSIDLD